MILPPELAAEPFCYVTTTGRVTGRPHTIEIWFGVEDESLYLLAGGRERSDTVRNLRREPALTVRDGRHTFAARGRVVDAADEDALARRLLMAKYAPASSDDLTDWGREALPVALDLEAEIRPQV